MQTEPRAFSVFIESLEMLDLLIFKRILFRKPFHTFRNALQNASSTF